MKVLFDNLALSAAISCAHPNANYPATNLQHVFLKKIFKSTANSDTLTITWAADQQIDACYLALSNGSAFELRLYGPTGTLLHTESIPTGSLCALFTKVEGVRSAQLDITASAPAYLGAVGLGAMYAMPNPVNDWVEGSKDNSSFAESADGQVLENHIAPLRVIPLRFVVATVAEYLAVKAKIDARSRPVFIDVFPVSHSLAPMYGIFTGRMDSPAKPGNSFTFSLTAREAR
jgi:hypothetical protein